MPSRMSFSTFISILSYSLEKSRSKDSDSEVLGGDHRRVALLEIVKDQENKLVKDTDYYTHVHVQNYSGILQSMMNISLISVTSF